MAAGVGSRISKYIDKPKCTLDIEDTTIIAHTVDMLKKNGMDVGVSVGYDYKVVQEALKGRDVTYFYNPFYGVTNSMASLWFAKDFLTDDTLLMNADVYWGQDILNDLLCDKRDVVMLADESRVNYGDYFFSVKDGVIENFGKELSVGERTTEYVGIAKISSNFIHVFKKRLETLIEHGKYDLWWENTLYEYISETPVYVRDVSQFFWAEVDYIEDYRRIQNYVKTGDIRNKFDT